MKSGKNKKTLKIAGATSVTLFSLVSVFAATIAWFAMNNKTDGSGLAITAANGSDVQILHCYAVRYDGDVGATAVDISNGRGNVEMSEYDYVFRDRNVNTPLFIRMEIYNFDPNDDLTVTIPCTGTYKTNNKVDPYLSNVISAKFLYGLKVGNNLVPDTYSWSGATATGAAVVSSYQGMLENAKDYVGTPFVNGNTKEDSITLTLDSDDVFDENYIVTRKDDENHDIDVAIIYVELDYHVTNTVNLVSNYLSSYGEGEQHAISFTSDIGIITVDNEASA